MVSIKLHYEVTSTKMSADSPRLNQYFIKIVRATADKLSINYCFLSGPLAVAPAGIGPFVKAIILGTIQIPLGHN